MKTLKRGICMKIKSQSQIYFRSSNDRIIPLSLANPSPLTLLTSLTAPHLVVQLLTLVTELCVCLFYCRVPMSNRKWIALYLDNNV